MNFLSSKSLSPQNNFGARLTNHNYPAPAPAARPLDRRAPVTAQAAGARKAKP